ncbi:outer membrane beta-barrel protein [Mucilaginibacter ginsenosidivorans]|uniref:Outer membrane beta-barrel protein n=1 Tax=Mucilaginibacter ginsenosidivorans TaxID=398053 RepID=A0A5B8UV80_9SPHI|nr:outer membrane beta-barrel protein [Mucilaginibacter ginsenosidivorans]QEC62832.1 outer membrane beta-barrel protein [Mucilaginibacter ginsenosidivorans]
MRSTLSLCLFISLFSLSVSAQSNYAVKGVIADSVEHAKLGNASVAVLEAKDSILVKFTRTAENGSFSLTGLTKGKFILLVSYPDYADYVEPFSLDSLKPEHRFGNINMNLKSRLLQEVIVKGTAAQIKIKGDTTEFNARAFVTQPNAKVEDLLKQLPGIQVDKDGKITAQGETVNKVLVDGEEFFGDDPTLVTKNLRADMVDKVQLYDKKSDQATFTGIDDGQRTKTLNIKLKEDKKNGYFGKADVGAGNDGYYQGQVLFNRFKGKQKFSVYGTVGNDGKTGLGWQDSQKYGGGSDNVQVVDDGVMFFSGGGDDLDSWNGNYDGKGIPIARTGGAHYDTKWNSDKESLNGNYKIGSLTVDGTDNNISQNNYSLTGVQNTNSDQKYHNYLFRQKLDATYKLKIDTTSDLKLYADGTSKNSQTLSDYHSSTTDGDGNLVNNNIRKVKNNVDTKIFDISAFYTKKFKKKGRTFSWNISESYNESTAKGNLYSDITSYTYNPNTSHDSIVDQYKTNDLKSSVLNSSMTYTEPLSKFTSVIFNYGLGIANSSADRKSFNQSSPGVYNVLDNTYSNDYKLNDLSNQGGAVVNYKRGKVTFNFGSKVTFVNFDQTNLYTGDEFKRTFVNWAPQAFIRYDITKQSGFNINYNGRTTQPTVDQIQPVLVNSDPLNIVLGNPNLTPSFTNNFRINYHSYKVLTDQYLGIYGNFSFITNPIVNSSVTDTSATAIIRGRTTTQYINLDKKPYNYYGGLYFGRKIPLGGLQIGLNLNANGSKNYNLSNNQLNIITSNSYSPSLQVSRYAEKKFNVNFNFGPTYTTGGSSLQKTSNNGHGFQGYGEFGVYLPGKFQISSDANYQYTSKTQTFPTDFSRVLWNAKITKSFTKEESFKLSLACNDILNQNSGFDRGSSGTLITQDRYTTIKRFFLVEFIWEFNHVGGGAPKK